MKTTRTTCPYCGVGCGVLVQQSTTGEITIKGDELHPANRGRLCSKGIALAETTDHPDRLLYPEVNGERVDWETASTAVADKFQQVITEHGPDAVAFYVSGQLLTEDYYVANKMMKGYIGSANIDTNSRLCMASAVAAHKRAFGEDLVPCSYEDLEAAELIVLLGSNTAWCHPVLYQRIVAAKAENSSLRIVLIDPRRTQTAEIADLHLALTPGSDAYLFNGLLAHLADHGLSDNDFFKNHTEGAELAVQTAREQSGSAAIVAHQCGLSEIAVEQFFALFASTEKVVSVFSQGVNQSSSGADKGNALINCHLLTGRIGKAGAGPFSFTGQPNAMGGREVGGLANQLAAHRDVDNPEHQQQVKQFWQSPTIANKQGLKAVDLFEAMHAGKIKAVWIMATNPAVSLPDSKFVKEALSRCECVIVSDCVASNDTLDYAHIRLPALTWGERDGTVTNSDRTISRQRPFMASPGEAKQDWEIICSVAKKMGYATAFSFQNAAGIFREHAALSWYGNDGTHCFDLGALTMLSPEDYDELPPIQWPIKKTCKNSKSWYSTKRLFSDGKFFTDSGHAKFIPIYARTPISSLSEDYPLILNTGRVRDHWHTMTRTGISQQLSGHRQEAYAEIHPVDAAFRGIIEGELVNIDNELGSICVRAQISYNQQVGSIFVPIHWSNDFANTALVSELIPGITDPISGQPESKHTPVQMSAYPASWHGFVISRQKLNATLNTIGTDFHWSVRRVKGAWVYMLTGTKATKDREIFVRSVFGVDEDNANWIEYLDYTQQTYRGARFNKNQLDCCIFTSANSDPLPSKQWLISLFAKSALEESERRALLTGGSAKAMPNNGKTVCACYNVGEKTIQTAIVNHQLKTTQEIGQCLQAGTNCGSCLPELREMLIPLELETG